MLVTNVLTARPPILISCLLRDGELGAEESKGAAGAEWAWGGGITSPFLGEAPEGDEEGGKEAGEAAA